MQDAELEQQIRHHLERQDTRAAVEAFVVGYGPAVFRAVRRRLGDKEAAHEVFAEFCAALCEDLVRFRWESSALTWGLRVATHAAIR